MSGSAGGLDDWDEQRPRPLPIAEKDALTILRLVLGSDGTIAQLLTALAAGGFVIMRVRKPDRTG